MRRSPCRYWGVSLPGSDHQEAGIGNQDAWLGRKDSRGGVVVLSDGMGSKKYAAAGAAAACRTVLAAVRLARELKVAFHPFLPENIEWLWNKALNGMLPRESACTCRYAVMDRELGWFWGGLGDGVTAVVSSSGRARLYQASEEDFANMTVGLGIGALPTDWQFAEAPLDSVSAIFLCSDGVSGKVIPGSLPSFFEQLRTAYTGQPLPEIRKDLRGAMRNWRVPGCGDDQTLVCLEEDVHND